jgi:hypothetical protein
MTRNPNELTIENSAVVLIDLSWATVGTWRRRRFPPNKAKGRSVEGF